MKFAITLFSMLLVVIGAMIFVQFQAFSEYEAAVEKEFHFTQEIEIEYRDDSLDIRHHFNNLPESKIDIIWPTAAVDINCFLEKEHSCKRINDSKTGFKAGGNHSQSISYVIPLNGQLKNDKMLEDVFAKLKLGDAGYTTVHITTSPNLKGTWVTGLERIGQQQLSLVNYTMFAGGGNIEDIYWIKDGAAFLKENGAVTVYSKGAVSNQNAKLLNELKLANEEHIAIVQTKNKPKTNSKRIIFVSTLKQEPIEYLATISHLNNVYNFKDVPTWVKQVIASVIIDRGFGDGRAPKVYGELKNKLTAEQYAKLKKELENLKNKEVTVASIDEALSNALGANTKFISLNVHSEQFFPLVFNDQRPITLNGEEKPNLHVVLLEGRVLYPTDALLKELGYTTSVGPNGYYVRNKNETYRFPNAVYDFYVYNNKRFNIGTSPFTDVAGVRYIEENWVQRLFNITIDKYDDEIRITTTAQ